MDGEKNGKPYFSMDDLGGKPTIFGNIHIGPRGKNRGYTNHFPCEGLYSLLILSMLFCDFFVV